MDSSTENVTILAGTITDVLKRYQSKKLHKELFEISENYDLSDPFNQVPIQVYNDMCKWIETKMGKFNLIKIGGEVGESAYSMLVADHLIRGNEKPLELVKALILSASKGVQDPKKRGWEILSHEEKSIIMRKTQTFNGVIQLGLLRSLIEKSGAERVRVTFHHEVSKGDDFDEYLITWR